MEGVPINRNGQSRYNQECPPTENSQSVFSIAGKAVAVNRYFLAVGYFDLSVDP